ncbi:MAG: S41 family peptidase [Melioribacteraceae bacterium]|nr:S41 family peptidase [Melioribacteraceae bacterium]
MRVKVFINTVLLSVMLLSSNAQSKADVYYEIANSIDIFGKVYKEITLNYVDEIDPREFMLSGIKGMLDALDPYTVYMDESNQKDIEFMTTGKYGGIGATIGLRNDRVTVVDLIEGYSAQRQGVRIGDVIVKVDSMELDEKNYDDLSLYMKGDPGTLVSVTIEREGVDEEIVFNLLREEVEVKNVTYFGFVPKESNNAYFKLSGFNRAAGEEIKKAFLELRTEKEIHSIVLDLRGNPGGLLDAAIDVADKFLNKGDVIVSVAGRDTNDITKYYADEEPIAGEVDLIVLIDKGSASASEIVAGAVQDHDRGVILGEASFGKGLVQNVIPLTSTTSLKITTGKYFTPSGRSIQKTNYLEESEVFVDSSGNLLKEEFRTDHNRVVYSGGGVQPDTTVSNNSESELIRSLLAQGIFFQFATTYFNTNENLEWQNLDQEKIFQDFKSYIVEKDFGVSTKVDKILRDLKKEFENGSFNDSVQERFNEFESELQKQKRNELDYYKTEVLAQLHKEISARTDGRIGRVEASFNYDNQLDTAVRILGSRDSYLSILALAEQQ